MDNNFDFLIFLYKSSESQIADYAIGSRISNNYLSFFKKGYDISVKTNVKIKKNNLKNEVNTIPFDIVKIEINFETQCQGIFSMYLFLSLYWRVFRELKNYEILNDDEGMGCPSGNFFNISILNPSLEHLNLIKTFINTKRKIKREIPNYIEFYYEKYERYWDSNIKLELSPISIINTNTKVRRLGYVKMILNMFRDTRYFPENFFNGKVEKEANNFKNDLLEYCNNKGEIKSSKTGYSSKPYLNFIFSLDLFYIKNRMISLSKTGKIFLVLENKLNSNNESNYFNLSKLERTFFIYKIFEKDSFFIRSILEIIYIQDNKTNLKQIKEVFQNYILDQIALWSKSWFVRGEQKRDLIAIQRRIKFWRNSKKYLEHIVEPRINWLIDVGIIESEAFIDNTIKLSSIGSRLIETFMLYEDIFLEKYGLTKTIITNDFFKIINFIYSEKYPYIIKEDINKIDYYIEESFYLFKTMAPNRVTASQAIMYCSFQMFFNEKKIVDAKTIINYLKSKDNTKYLFEWYKTQNDGSIKIKK